jgi:hypothetical protein
LWNKFAKINLQTTLKCAKQSNYPTKTSSCQPATLDFFCRKRAFAGKIRVFLQFHKYYKNLNQDSAMKNLHLNCIYPMKLNISRKTLYLSQKSNMKFKSSQLTMHSVFQRNQCRTDRKMIAFETIFRTVFGKNFKVSQKRIL